MSIDVRAVIREVLHTSSASDPDDLVALVFKEIPAADRGEALRQTLRPLVREGISLERMAHPIPTGTRPTAPMGSWKVRTIRENWERALRSRLHVGAGEWKLLAECTRDDLLCAALEREMLAEQNAAAARNYTALAELLTMHGAATVADLPPDILGGALGDAT